jgi:hypothetical protein
MAWLAVGLLWRYSRSRQEMRKKPAPLTGPPYFGHWLLGKNTKKNILGANSIPHAMRTVISLMGDIYLPHSMDDSSCHPHHFLDFCELMEGL